MTREKTQTEYQTPWGLACTVIRSSRRTLALSVTHDARVLIRAPHKMPMEHIAAFVTGHRAWLDRHLSRAHSAAASRGELLYQNGDLIPILGEAHTLRRTRVDRACIQNTWLLVPEHTDAPAQAVAAFLHRLGESYLPQRIEHFAEALKVTPQGWRVTAARTRWGSCSGKNRLCFSYRLLCLPPDLVDAVVVHELAHIRHKDHSAAFYATIRAVLPDYEQRRRALRDAARTLAI